MAEDMPLNRKATLILNGKKAPAAQAAFPEMAESEIQDDFMAEDDEIART